MEKQIKLFLNSELDEGDYYSLSKENLLTLREYLLKLKEKDDEFQSRIQNQFNSIKEKCDWLEDINFDGVVKKDGTYEMSAIYLNSNDGVNLIVRLNKNHDQYEELVKKVPKLYLVSSKVRKHLARQEDIKYIQEELREIDNIGRDVYKGVLGFVYSRSENFLVYNTPNKCVSVYNDYELICEYLNESKKHKETGFLKDKDKKEKLLEKILIKPNAK